MLRGLSGIRRLKFATNRVLLNARPSCAPVVAPAQVLERIGGSGGDRHASSARHLSKRRVSRAASHGARAHRCTHMRVRAHLRVHRQARWFGTGPLELHRLDRGLHWDIPVTQIFVDRLQRHMLTLAMRVPRALGACTTGGRFKPGRCIGGCTSRSRGHICAAGFGAIGSATFMRRRTRSRFGAAARLRQPVWRFVL